MPLHNFDSEAADPEIIKNSVLSEISELKETQSFDLNEIKDGSWFPKFVEHVLRSYHDKIMANGGEAYLRDKYPGLPTDAIASKLCEMAQKMSALAGAGSGAAASAAVLATAGIATPAAIATIMGEVYFTVRLQMRLVHDLHLLYGTPIDANDPEDLMAIFATAYGVKAAEVGGLVGKTIAPEAARANLRRLIQGNTPLIQNAVGRVLGPRIGRSVTQKAMLKVGVPIVGVAISAGWNFGTTRSIAKRVCHEVRVKAALREETRRLRDQLVGKEEAERAVMEGLMALALADGHFDDFEREVYQTFLKQLDLPEAELEALAQSIDADLDAVCKSLRTIKDDRNRHIIGRCFRVITAADGEIREEEIKVLARLLEALQQLHLIEELEPLAERFRRDDGTAKKVLASIGTMASNSGEKAGAAVGGAMSWMKGKLRKNSPPAEESTESFFCESSTEHNTDVIIQEMNDLTEELASGSIDNSTYLQKWGVLAERLEACAQ